MLSVQMGLLLLLLLLLLMMMMIHFPYMGMHYQRHRYWTDS
jgi:hypothetical protein